MMIKSGNLKIEIGDIIVYTNHGSEWIKDAELIIGHKYTIDYIDDVYDYVKVKEKQYYYHINRFESIHDNRLKKINRIKNNIK